MILHTSGVHLPLSPLLHYESQYIGGFDIYFLLFSWGSMTRSLFFTSTSTRPAVIVSDDRFGLDRSLE
jgi:hypothetical protein